jgi:hypothetical protein
MTRIVNEARVRAASAPGLAGQKGLKLLASPFQGDRIVGIALLQVAREIAGLGDLLRLVSGSATAFEMYHALLALQDLVLAMNSQQRAHTAEVLESELADPRGVGVLADPALPSLIRHAISELSV